jgi:hypothetical protein
LRASFAFWLSILTFNLYQYKPARLSRLPFSAVVTPPSRFYGEKFPADAEDIRQRAENFREIRVSEAIIFRHRLS